VHEGNMKDIDLDVVKRGSVFSLLRFCSVRF